MEREHLCLWSTIDSVSEGFAHLHFLSHADVKVEVLFRFKHEYDRAAKPEPSNLVTRPQRLTTE